MMRSLYSGVSGLKGHQTRMDVIGNNIANVNTTGFKSSRVTFADTLSQTLSGAGSPSANLGGTNPKQIGLGTGVSSIDMLFTDGAVQSTGKNTDLCLSGNGLFVVKKGNETFYTRNGAFEFDANGNLVMPGSGMKVQGYIANNGDISNVAGDPDGDIQIQVGKGMDAAATTLISYTKNLQGDMTGYDISNMIIKYADGTQETINSYTPTKVDKGTISLTTDTGEVIEVDDTAGFNFTTNQVLDGVKLWTENIDSVTANSSGTVDVQVKSGASSTLVSPSPLDLKGLTSGNYSYGGSIALSGTIITNGVTAIGPATNPNSAVEVSFKLDDTYGTSAGTVVKVRIPNPQNATYRDGDTVAFGGFTIGDITANTGAVVNCANGRTDPLPAPYSVTSSAQLYERKGRGTDGSITAITRNGKGTAYKYNGKEVNSLSIVTSDGKTLSGLLGKNYSSGDTFYSSITTTVTLYDTDGGVHSVPVLFTRTAGAESTWELSLAGGSDTYNTVEDDGTTFSVSLSKSDLVFDGNGRYVSGSASLSTSSSGDRAYDDGDVTLNLSGLTQYAGTSTISNKGDGNASGTLQSVSIDSTGVITGVYSNGVKQAEAKIAIATFNNAAGLTKTGNSLYQESNNSGKVSYDSTGSTITSSALEMSNVDIANEFSDMIVTQRGFQSNSKIITVSDEMLETMINMKR
ncbi:flagellar hook protein FlgE [Selenomonas sp. WCT3]|uniref:flagellar hook-basal body complex protein n=1 Tax=Selenomonas sp. WCT3 TaxID=3158785 RepID=UPI0008835362|nr:flagellar hook protein FlgE [Selenomonas ruminantium]